MRFLALSLACVFIGSAAAHDETTAPVRPDFSVLTPSMDGRFVVASGADLTAIVPPYLSLGALNNNARSSELRKLVANERYDPARTLADRLIEALAERGYRAAYEPMTRKPAGSVQAPDKAAPVPESPYPPVVVSGGCAFDSVKQAAKDPQRLWGCFGEAYDVAVQRLVIDLEKRQPPPTLSASGDTPSGTSR